MHITARLASTRNQKSTHRVAARRVQKGGASMHKRFEDWFTKMWWTKGWIQFVVVIGGSALVLVLACVGWIIPII